MSEEIIKVLDAVCAKFGVVIDWSAKNVLPYVTQLTEKFIKWELGTSIAWISIMGLVLAILGVLVRVTLPKAREYDWDLDEGMPWVCILMIGLTFVVGFAFIIVLGHQVLDIVTCCTFPEKAILDYAMSIVNK